MIDPSNLSNTYTFAVYAKGQPEIWQTVVGYQVTHATLGVGTIKAIEVRNNVPYIEICFETDSQPSRKFNQEAFSAGQYFLDMQLPPIVQLQDIERIRSELQRQIQLQEQTRIAREQYLAEQQRLRAEEYQRRIEEQQRKQREEQQRRAEEQRRKELERQQREAQQKQLEEQRRKEQAAAQEFAILKSKYRATTHKDTSPASPLYVILVQMEANEPLTESQIDWLKAHHLSATLALYFQERYRQFREAWDLVKASSYWRDADEPEQSIKLTSYLLEKQALETVREKAATLTTRGGAFRDLGQLEEAEQCAEDAIKYSPTSFQPYNLLGAIYFERGDGERGEEYFRMAAERGAPPRSQEYQMQDALDSAGEAQRVAVAQYLLSKDPERYKWAEYYLPELEEKQS